MLALKTSFCGTFGIAHPIVQAGMAGGATTPELVAAVSEAGGLGTLGAAYMKPEAIGKAVADIRALTDKPFAVNLFANVPPDDFSRYEEVQEALRPFREALGIEAAASRPATTDLLADQLEVCIGLQVPVLSAAFGCFEEAQMKRIRQHGILTTVMVTTVAEALEAEACGADAIVAQGSEAGGHRSTFSLDRHPDGAQIGTFSLVPQIADAVGVPVIAAGGVADGRGLVAALALGAEAVQVGTRFLTAEEAGTHPLHKQALFESDEESTVITKSFSGRPARGIRNRFIKEFGESGTDPLPFPSQNTVTQPIRQAAAKQGDAGFLSLWAGQTTRMLDREMPARAILEDIIEGARRLL